MYRGGRVRLQISKFQFKWLFFPSYRGSIDVGRKSICLFHKKHTQNAPSQGTEWQKQAERQTWIPEILYTMVYKFPFLFFSSSHLLESNIWEETDQKCSLGLAWWGLAFAHKGHPLQCRGCLSFLLPPPSNKRSLKFLVLLSRSPHLCPKFSSRYCSKHPTS